MYQLMLNNTASVDKKMLQHVPGSMISGTTLVILVHEVFTTNKEVEKLKV